MLRRIGFLLILGLLVAGLHLKTEAAPPRFPAFNRFATARLSTTVVTELFGSSFQTLGYGELIVPDQVHLAQFDPEFPEELEEVFIVGTTLYQIDELAGVWDAILDAPGVNGTAGYEPGLPPDLAASITEIKQLPNEVVAGVPTRRYRAEIDSATLLAWPEEPTAADRADAAELGVNVEFWIGVADGIVRQQQTLAEFKDFSTKPPEVIRTIQVITYHAINEPLQITPPTIEVPPTPEVPPEGVAIYPPKYPLAGTAIKPLIERLRTIGEQRGAPLRTTPSQVRPGSLR